MASDGSIEFSIELDAKEAEQELSALKKKILGLEAELEKKQRQRPVLAAEMERIGAAADAAKAKLAELTSERDRLKALTPYDGTEYLSAQQRLAEITTEIKEQEAAVKGLDKDFNSAASAVEKCDDQIRDLNIALDVTKEQYGTVAKQAAAMPSPVEKTASAAEEASKRMQKFTTRVKGLVRQLFVFSLISSALRSLRSYLGDAIKSNDEASAAVARLRGALLTLAQPLLQVVIPAFTTLVNVLTRIANAAANVMAALFGMTASASAKAAEALYDEQNALKGVGGAAKSAGRSLASFDEINQLSGGSSGGSSGSSIAPDFSGIDDQVSPLLESILTDVLAIGAGLLAWRIARSFTSELSTLGGVAMIVAGALMLGFNAVDAWNNGVDWENLIGMVAGLALVVGGLAIALGPVAAGIAAVVGGLALLVIGMRDAMKSGMNWSNTLLMIAGILATGLGLSLLTGSFIPLFIAALGAAMLALVQFTGHGEELMNGLRDIFNGFIQFITGIWEGDWVKAFAGLRQMAEGFKTAWGAIVQSVKDAWASFVQWFDDNTNGEFHYILDAIETFFTGTIDSIKTILSGVIDFVAGVFTGDWDRAWKGVQNVFIGIWNGIVTVLETAINFLISGVNAAQQGIVKALNSLLTLPDWVPEIGGKTLNLSPNIISPISLPRVPALARGAVIPPNREFLAVLGDQKQGTNIEAPLDTIMQAFRQVMSEQGGGRKQTIVLMLDRRELGRAVVDVYDLESQRVGVKLGGVT